MVRFSLKKSAVAASIGAGILCGYLFASRPAAPGSQFAPPVPPSWIPSIRWQSQVARDTFFEDLSPSIRRLGIVQDLQRVRKYPPQFYLTENERTKDPRTGRLLGEQVPGDSRFPYSDQRGTLLLTSPSVFFHEWLHAHPEVSKNHYSASDAISAYFQTRHEALSMNLFFLQRDFHPVEQYWHYHWRDDGFSKSVEHRIRFSKVNAAFRRLSSDDHNLADAGGKHLGWLAWSEECRQRKPGLGLVLMKLVFKGIPVEKALKMVGQHSQEAHRKKLVRRNPALDWLKNRTNPAERRNAFFMP